MRIVIQNSTSLTESELKEIERLNTILGGLHTIPAGFEAIENEFPDMERISPRTFIVKNDKIRLSLSVPKGQSGNIFHANKPTRHDH